MRAWRAAAALAACSAVGACGSCSKKEDPVDASAPSPSASFSGVVAELLPRCRGEAQRLPIPGEDVIVGDVAVGPSGLLVGVIRTEGGKRSAAVMRVPLDLASSRVFEVGPALGDDPPPSPRWNGTTPWVTFLTRQPSDAGLKLRALQVARLDDAAPMHVESTISQQADESTAYDIAWSEGAALAAWDEDAPTRMDAATPETAERGFVKVELLGRPDARPRVASPESSDAESPRLVARPGGFWLAWLARRPEEEVYAVEGPGERRAFRWVEAVALDARGETVGAVRRVSPEKGRAIAFELGRHGPNLVVMVQDEVASSEGAGARIIRYEVGEGAGPPASMVDGGVGHALAELVPMGGEGGESARWITWTDLAERAHMTPLGAGLVASGHASAEASLDGARVLAAAPPDILYALAGAGDPAEGPGKPVRPELRRFACK